MQNFLDRKASKNIRNKFFEYWTDKNFYLKFCFLYPILTKYFIVILSPQKNKNISPIVMQNKTLSLADRDHFQNLLIDKLYDP